jgi:hypothetical protein
VTRSSRLAYQSCFTYTIFVALFEPRDVGHALSDSSWVNAMHVELENFERNKVWTLVESPRDVPEEPNGFSKTNRGRMVRL